MRDKAAEAQASADADSRPERRARPDRERDYQAIEREAHDQGAIRMLMIGTVSAWQDCSEP